MAGTPSGVRSGQDCSQEQKRPAEGPRCVALDRGPLVVTSETTDVNLGIDQRRDTAPVGHPGMSSP